MYDKDDLFYAIFKTRAGWIGIYGSKDGLKRSTLPQNSKEQAMLCLGKLDNEANYSEEYFQELINQYQDYFEGQKIDFTVKLNLSKATEFQSKVWEATRNIPYGETRSYGWVARQINQPLAPRGVGQALGRNPFPIIIPCHRVIGSDGTLRGFGGGWEMKRYLLNLEVKKN